MTVYVYLISVKRLFTQLTENVIYNLITFLNVITVGPNCNW